MNDINKYWVCYYCDIDNSYHSLTQYPISYKQVQETKHLIKNIEEIETRIKNKTICQ